MRSIALLLIASAAFGALASADEIPLRANDPAAEDAYVEHQVGGAQERWISHVGRASLIVYPAAKDKASGAAVIVCPGGGYQNLVIDAEGRDVAQWLSSIGVTAFVLKYRLPLTQGAPNTVPSETKGAVEALLPAVEDARLALKIVHDRAPEWGVRTEAIGMMGFSAGGHLAAIVGNERGPNRPSFLALIYPSVPTDIELTADSPKVFLAMADNDQLLTADKTVFRYYLAAKKAGVRSELHIFASGGHGFAVRKLRTTSNAFPALFENWMRSLRFLTTLEKNG